MNQVNKSFSLRSLIEGSVEWSIFTSRWLQAPLYLGLIVVQFVYSFKFIEELYHIVITSHTSTEVRVLLGVLSLVDFTMVANLVAVVIIGGYATFVSKLNLEHSPDKPDWLDHIDPGTIKIKLASSLIGISSIHLLRSFIDVDQIDPAKVKIQMMIHLTFVISTIFLALSEYFMAKKTTTHTNSHHS